MKLRQISSGATINRNEDLIAVYETGDFTDIIIMDGGSSVAEKDFDDSEIGDVVWFATNFASSLERAISRDPARHEALRQIQ